MSADTVDFLGET